MNKAILEDLITAYIYREYGSAVCEQFEAICDGKPVKDQNQNAVRYIISCLRSLSGLEIIGSIADGIRCDIENDLPDTE